MRVPRLFLASLNVGEAALSREEAVHAARVLVLRDGETVELFNGKGLVGRARVRTITKGSVKLWVHDVRRTDPDAGCGVTLCVAPPKGDRQHFLVEKCTELGATALRPLLTTRGVARPSDALLERWRRWALEACKQCGRNWMPVILPGAAPNEALGACPANSLPLLAHREAAASPWNVIRAQHPRLSHVVVFIGPEGGWTDEELAWATGSGLTRLHLGDSTLRVETSAVAATTLIRLHPPAEEGAPPQSS